MLYSESSKSLLDLKIDPNHVEKIVREVADRIKHYVETKTTSNNVVNDLSLASGLTGICLFIGELDSIYPDEDWDLLGHECLKLIQTSINKYGIDLLSLWSGIAGVGFAAYSLSRKGTRYSSFISKINMILSNNLNESINHYMSNTKKGIYVSDYDVILGLTGVGRYLLLFAEDTNIYKHIERIMEYLITISKEKLVMGRLVPGWHISSENHLEESFRTFPKGFFDVGLAHGISGALALLSLSLKEGIMIKGQDDAIRRITDWLLNIKYEDEYGPIWPSKIGLNHLYENAEELQVASYEAWCYGSPGVARALWLAGAALNDESLKKIAINTYIGCFKRPKSRRNITSSTFCHGYAGFLCLTQSMYEDTQIEEIRKLKDQLVYDICDQYSEGNTFGFYDFNRINSEIIHDPGLLTGSSGIALSLLSSITGKKTNWDSAFLIN